MKKKTVVIISVLLLIGLITVFCACYQPIIGATRVTVNYYDGETLLKSASVDSLEQALEYAPTKEGMEFKGWYLDASFANGLESLGESAEVGLSVYAYFEPLFFEVVFRDDDNNVLLVNGEASQSIRYGNGATAPSAPEKSGFVFDGWSVAFDNVKSDLTIRPTWQAAAEGGSLVFMLGSELLFSEVVEADIGLAAYANTVEENLVIPRGFAFDAWFRDSALTLPIAVNAAVVPQTGLTLFAKLKLLPITGLSIAYGSDDSFVYSEDLKVLLTAEFARHDNITYGCEWYFGEVGESVVLGNTPSVTLEGLDAGAYTVAMKVTASAPNAGAVSATDTISFDVELASLEDLAASDRIDAAEVSVTYDGKPHRITITGLLTGDTVSYALFGESYSPNAIDCVRSGVYNIAYKVERRNYIPFEGRTTLTVAKALLTVKAEDKTVIYGDAMPSFTYTCSGFVNRETISVVTGNAQYACESINTLTIGQFAINVGGFSAADYEITYLSGDLTVNKRPLYITADDKTAAYGGIAPIFTAKISGFFGSDSASLLDGEISFDCEYAQGSDAGNYPILPKGLSSDKYEMAYISGNLAVSKRSITVTAENKTAYYGDDTPALTVRYSGFIEGDDENGLDGELLFNYGGYRKGKAPGTYPIAPEGLESANYDITFVDATLTVHKVLLNITVDNYTVTYGDDSPDYTVRYSGFITGENESKLTGVLRFECDYPAIKRNAGSYTITAGGLGSNNYDISYISGSLTVEKKALTVTADNKVIVYGDSIPTFGTIIDGFIEGDDAGELTGEAFFSCEYVPGNETGSYDIEVSNLFSPNYTITFVKGTLQVGKAALTVTAANKAVIYGADAPAYVADYSGFIEGDGLSGLSGTLAFECAYSKGSPAGNYPIKASGFDSDNYNIVYVDGTLGVGKRNIEIKARSDFAETGNIWEKSDWSGIIGLYGSDEVCGTLKTVSAIVGVYAAEGALSSDFAWVGFDISSPLGSVASSYDISYVLHIEIKENWFDYTANGVNATYNGSAYSISVSTPELSREIFYSENGVDFGNDNPSYTQAGTYTVYYKITDSYYDDIIGTCEVKIAKAVLTVTAADASITYGQNAPSFSAAVTGYVNGENASVLGGSLAYDCSYGVGSGAGTYTVMPYGLAANNYRFEYIDSTLTVGKAQLTVTAADQAVAYGGLAPQYSAEYEGFKAGDTYLDLSGTLKYNCGYIAGSALGSYPITPYGLSSSNYQITYAAGTLTVSAKSITVYAEDKTTVYGLAAPNFSAACDELFGSDTIADIVGLTFECSYTAGNDAKGYAITISGGSNANYSIGYRSGTLTVTPKQITATASDKTVAYGTASVAYTIEASGLIAGDTVAMLGTPGFDCEYAFGSSVGSYTITPKNLNNANYSYTYANGTLTVTAKSAAVIWYGTDVDYYYNASDQSGSVKPGITDINGDTVYTSVTFVGAGSSFLNAGYYTLTASLANDNYTLTNTVKNFRMYKGEYSGITHHALTGTYSPAKTLSDIALDENYFWVNPSAVPTVPVTGYAAVYNADYSNYNNFALTVTVNLQKALAVVTGSTIQEATYGGGAASLSLGVSYEGAALSASLYTFKYTNGNSFTAAGTYKTSVTITSDNFRVNATDYYMKVKGVLYGSNYYTIEDALNAASSGTVIVATDTSFASADNSCYNGSGYYTVKSGVHLLVPYSSAHSTSLNTVNGTATALGGKYVRLTVPSGVTLTVNGTLNVNAERSHQSTTSMGHTSGSYGEMKLDEGSLVILNSSATLNSMGFVTGTGYINALSGSKVYDVLAIKDFRGGKISYSIRNDYFAFNQYTMHNIEANLRIYYGSSMYCRYYVYTSAGTANSDMIVVGSGAVFQLASGYLQKYMDASTGKTYLDLYGTMTTNSVTLELKVNYISFSINTTNKEFPLSGNYTVSIKSGSTGTINNRFKLLPGAEFIVEQGATLNITSSGRLYMFGKDADFGNSEQFSNGISLSGASTPAYGSAACRVNTRTKNVTYSLTDNARLIVNGTLNMAGYIGGLIETSGTTGVINLTSGTLSSTMKDCLKITKDGTLSVDYELKNVTFTAKGYLNGNTTNRVNLSKTTYHADSNGTNTWV